jgi:hypothetical protein
MSNLISREKASHFYLPSGAPLYEVPNKSKGGMRPATLADARKVGALPSVTNVLSVCAKPGLEAWKQEQAIIAALTLPRLDGEALDAFAVRVVEDMGDQAAKAAEFGTQIHAACEEYARSKSLPSQDSPLLPFLKSWVEWFDKEVLTVIQCEEVVVGKGYAGRVDLSASTKSHGYTFIDLKTQKIKGKPVFYPEWGMQLAAYCKPSAGLAKGLSVVIDSAEPGPVYTQTWDMEENYKAFEHALGLWQHMKGYKVTA